MKLGMDSKWVAAFFLAYPIDNRRPIDDDILTCCSYQRTLPPLEQAAAGANAAH